MAFALRDRRELIRAVSNERLSAIREAIGVGYVDSIMSRTANQRPNTWCDKPRHGSHVENTWGFPRCRRANASKCPVSFEERSTVSENASM